MSTGFSPLELHFGSNLRDQILDILNFPDAENLSRDIKVVLARSRLNGKFEQRPRSQGTVSRKSLKINELVLLHVPKLSDAFKKLTRKFFHLYYGPYRISRDFENNAFELVDVNNPERIIGIYNRCRLKKYIKPEDD